MGFLRSEWIHVMVADDMLMRPLACCTRMRQCEQKARPQKEVDPIIVDTPSELMTYQPGRDGVEDFAQREPAR